MYVFTLPIMGAAIMLVGVVTGSIIRAGIDKRKFSKEIMNYED